MNVIEIKKKYSAYPKYKRSGIDWLGNIPEDWEAQTLKNLGFFTSSGIDKKIVEGEPLVKMVNYTDIYGNTSLIIDKNRELMTVSCPAWKVLKSDLTSGDLVFTPSSETTEDIGLSALIFEKLKNTVFSYHVIRFRFKQVFDHLFKKYLCNNNFVLQQFTQLAKGTTRQIIDRNDFKNICVVIPTLKVQEYISKFLDNQIEKIDLIIEKKQKLIELLKEKRTVLISQTVAKGLDPQDELKFSGIEWLGDIPDDWKVKRIKDVTSINSETLSENTPSEYYLKYIDISNVDSEGKIIGIVEMYFENAPSRARRIVIKKDVIISTVRTYLKAISYLDNVEENTIVSTGFAVLRSKKDILPNFLNYFVRSNNFIDSVMSHSEGVSYPAINPTILGGLKICFPNIEQQKIIADFLDTAVNKINKAIEKIQQQIEFIKEYRMTLITNAVTGKIRIN